MNWNLLKVIYKIEKERVNSPLLILVFSFLTSIFICIILFKSDLVYNEKQIGFLLIQQFLTYMAVFFGISFSMLFIEELKSDYNKGIFHTYLTYPVNPSTVVISKLLAMGINVFIGIFISLLVFISLSNVVSIWGIRWLLAILLGFFVLLYVVYIITFMVSIMANLSPIPEMLILVYFLTITFFSFALPSQYLSILAPFITLPKFIIGINSPSKETMFSIISIILYGILAYGIFKLMNYKKRKVVS